MNYSLKKTTLFSLTIVLLCTLQLTAATYKGNVVDTETGKGIEGAVIKLQNSTGATVSDSTGAFSFSASLDVKHHRSELKGGPILRYFHEHRGFFTGKAANLQSIEVYSLQGRCIAAARCTPAADYIPFKIPSCGLYVLRLLSDNRNITLTWNHNGTSQHIAYGTTPAHSRRNTSGEVEAALSVEKNGYQKELVQIEAGRDYDKLQITMKPLIGNYIFDDDTVRTYRLYLSKDEIDHLLDFNLLVSGYTVNKVWVKARLVFESRSLDTICVRFRGDQSIWDCVSGGERKKDVHYPQFGFGNDDVCAKFSMKFDFNRVNSDSRLYGLKALNFRSMSFDPTKLHERLGYSLFHDMGINAPRAVHARLYVNDSLWGIFCVVEEIDGRFVKSRYPLTGDGNLYKDAWPEEAASESSLLSALETNNDPDDDPDVSDFMEFRDNVISEETDSVSFLEKVSKLIDIPHLVRYLAVDRGIGNFDGIVSAYAFNGSHMRHNYAWYHNEESGLFELIPWDLDKILLFPEPNFWSENKPLVNNPVPNWNVINHDYTPIVCTFDPGPFGGYYVEPIDADKFLRLVRSTTWDQFTAKSRYFLDSCFTIARVNGRIEKWRRQIAADIGKDPSIDSIGWCLMVDSLKNTIPLLHKNIELMIDTLIVR